MLESIHELQQSSDIILKKFKASFHVLKQSISDRYQRKLK